MIRRIILSLVVLGLISTGGFTQSNQKTSGDINQVIEFLEFREVDIKDVLRQLARQYDLNIIFSEAVKGLITIQLHGVTIDEALDSIITVNGYIYTKKGSVIKVTTPDEAEKEGKQTRVFRLNNADALKLKDTLGKVLSNEGKIEADARSNSLIVTDNVAIMSKIGEMIPKLDEGTKQVLIEARFIETTLGSSEKMGIDWGTTISASGSSRPVTFPFNKWGSDKDMYPAPSTSSNTSTTTTGTVTTTSTSELGFPTRGGTVGSFPMVGASQFTFGALNLTQLKATLDFLKSRSDAKLLSSPRIVTTDNKEARISVGQTIRILTEQNYDEQTKQTRYTYEKEDVGVILTVTPQISPDDRIKLKLKPEVSSVVGYNPGTSIQIIGKRTAETEVVIKDGQTIVIGGLVKEERTVATNKVPILGDIPLLGLLFTHKQVDPQSKVELLIFVTARLVKDSDDAVLALESSMVTTKKRPLKLNLREVKIR